MRDSIYALIMLVLLLSMSSIGFWRATDIDMTAEQKRLCWMVVGMCAPFIMGAFISALKAIKGVGSEVGAESGS